MGGVLVLAGANAPAGLASMPVRMLQMDEVDRYPESAGTEGDPGRPGRKAHDDLLESQEDPGVNAGHQEPIAYREGGRRERPAAYFVPCPECGLMQPLRWNRLQYDREPGEKGPVTGASWYECLAGCDHT
jgi:phage terminase large subunit GpA-like protein